jgi:hypothetical protein
MPPDRNFASSAPPPFPSEWPASPSDFTPARKNLSFLRTVSAPAPAAIIFALDKRIAGCILLIHAARAHSRHRAGAWPVDLPAADPACCRQRGLGIKPGSSRDQCGGRVITPTSPCDGRDNTPTSQAMNRRKSLVFTLQGVSGTLKRGHPTPPMPNGRTRSKPTRASAANSSCPWTVRSTSRRPKALRRPF